MPNIIEELAEEIEKPLRAFGDEFKKWYKKSGIEEKMPPTNHKKALKYYEEGNIEKAEHYFKKCLEKHGIYGLSSEKRANCANYLSKIYLDQEDNIKAFPYLKEALELSPENLLYHQNLVGYYWNNKDFTAAYHQAKKCVAVNIDESDPIFENAKATCTKILGIIEPYVQEL